MKRITIPFIAVLLVMLSTTAFAKGHKSTPSWLDLGVKGSYNPNMIMNFNYLNDGSYKYKYSAGYSIGGKLGYNFDAEHALTIDVSSTRFKQMTNVTYEALGSSVSQDYTLSAGYLDLMLLYRGSGETGGYTEFGPMYSMNLKGNLKTPSGSSDAKSSMNSGSPGLIFGFGQYIGGGEVFGFMFGVRAGYQFSDMIKKSTATYGSPVYTPLTDDAISSYKYKASHPVYVGFILELNFDFGYMASAACGKNTKFLLFK